MGCKWVNDQDAVYNSRYLIDLELLNSDIKSGYKNTEYLSDSFN